MPDERQVSSSITSVSNGHSMFRIVDRPLNFRQRASDWIYKMLFLWSREPTQNPRASPWFAWLAMAVLIWGCRRRILRAILAISPLRLVKRRRLSLNVNSKRNTREAIKTDEKLTMILHPKNMTGVRTKIKRLCTGDGPHVPKCNDLVQMTQQVHYRVTRSGRVYGKYPNKVVISS